MMPANRALLRAAADGDSHRLRALLVQGTNVNCTNGAGQTALMLAAAFNRQEIVNLLLKARAKVEVQDDLGLTALDWGANFPEIVELITRSMERPELKPDGGETKAEAAQANASFAATAAFPAQDPHADIEKSTLTGLAGAILRDRKPAVINEVQSVAVTAETISATGAIPSQVTGGPTVAPLSTDDTVDQTLGSSRQPAPDDTAPGSMRISHSRVLDLPALQPSKPPGKVQVQVPQPVAKRSWKQAVLWILPALLVGAVLFGSYQLVTLVLEKTRTTPTQSQAAKPTLKGGPTAVPTSSPVVSAELAGAELYLPDVEYPADVEPGQAAKVTVKVHVSAKGIVVGANAVDGDEPFRTVAEKTAKSSAFSPDKLQGKGPFIDGTITYSFASKPTTQLNSQTGLSQGKVSAIEGGPLAGSALSLAIPDYSRSAQKEGVAGTVTVVVRVSRSGTVKSWRALDGDARLRSASIKAAKRSRFSAGKLPGSGDVVGTITYTFQ
jgi:TonB family protein